MHANQLVKTVIVINLGLLQMSRRYDARTTTFSPEGRLFQVEYAMEAINHAGTVIGIVAKDGVVLVAEKKVVTNLLENSTEKIFSVTDNIVCGVAGITSDANTLVATARMQAQQYLFTFDQDMPVEQLVQQICNIKQRYTQSGGMRPFGVSLLYCGYDDKYGYQLYHSDPSGNYAGWKATCIGQNNGAAESQLKEEYKDDMTLVEAVQLGFRVLAKTLDSPQLSSDKCSIDSCSGSSYCKTGQWQSKVQGIDCGYDCIVCRQVCAKEGFLVKFVKPHVRIDPRRKRKVGIVKD